MPAKQSLLILAFGMLSLPLALWCYSFVAKPLFVARYVLPLIWLGWGILLAFPIQFLCERAQQAADRGASDPFFAWGRFVPLALSAIALLAVMPRLVDCVQLIRNGLSEGSLMQMRALRALPKNETVAFLFIQDYLFAKRYSDHPQNFILIGDADWAYSDASDVPQEAAINYKTAIALRRQYGVPYCNEKYFFEHFQCRTFVCRPEQRQLYTQWKQIALKRQKKEQNHSSKGETGKQNREQNFFQSIKGQNSSAHS